MSLKYYTKFFAFICIGLSISTSVLHAQLDTYQTIQSTDKINFTFFDVNDNKHQLNEYNGKIVILNVWATWCPPCVAELPSLNEIGESFPDDIVILTLLKNKKTIDVAQKMFASKGIKKLNLCYDHNDEITTELKVKGLPTTFIIDRRGYVIGKQAGGIQWDHIDVLTLMQSYAEGKITATHISMTDKLMAFIKNFFKSNK